MCVCFLKASCLVSKISRLLFGDTKLTKEGINIIFPPQKAGLEEAQGLTLCDSVWFHSVSPLTLVLINHWHGVGLRQALGLSQEPLLFGWKLAEAKGFWSWLELQADLSSKGCLALEYSRGKKVLGAWVGPVLPSLLCQFYSVCFLRGPFFSVTAEPKREQGVNLEEPRPGCPVFPSFLIWKWLQALKKKKKKTSQRELQSFLTHHLATKPSKTFAKQFLQQGPPWVAGQTCARLNLPWEGIECFLLCSSRGLRCAQCRSCWSQINVY